MKKETGMPNFVEMEKDIVKLWEKQDSFKKLVEKNKDGERYRFLDGPITANNEMGIHHVWGRTLKDTYIKYKSMKGYSCQFQNGFDAHGTPVEVAVEKALGINDKKELIDFGLNNFVEACLNRVDEYSAIQTKQSIRLGQWMDWDNSYYTNKDYNITAIWHFLKKCDKNGWLKLSYKPMMWCPRCGTSLSDHEMTGSYKDIEHIAVFFKLPVKEMNAKILVWTTTPWTLSSNVAVAVNPENDYLLVKVKSDDLPVIVGKEAVKILKDDAIEILKEFKGSELLGKQYEAVFPELEVQDFKHIIVPWEDVNAEEGTGAVHIAPGCGQEDHELGHKLGLPEICPIDESGEFLEEFGFLSGLNTKASASVIFDRLKQDNKLYYTHKYKHSYPVCWRCKEEIVFRLIDSWCITVDEIRPKLIKEVEKIEWQPTFLKKRMLDWLENMGDWHISRSRFYGVPLPIYPCECGHTTIVGSLEELAKLSSQEEVDAMEHLHRPQIDKIEITCEKCGKKVKRIPDVGDTWLDAGITPFSTKKYFTDKEFFNKNFPSETIIEMIEQIRLWFYSLLFMSVTLEGRAPYEKVVGHAAVIKEDGTRFSKSGFMIRVNEVAEKMGVDPARYLYASANLNTDVRFGYNLLGEVRRKLLGLFNAYTFFNTYAVIDKPELENYTPNYEELNVSDKWLVNITNEFIAKADEAYSKNESYIVTKEFESYIDNLTNFYIRVNRRRFWKSENEADKLNAYWVLYTALKTAVQVISPILPFMTEYIWQNMVRKIEKDSAESVYLSNFPTSVMDTPKNDIVNQVNTAMNVIAIGQRLRSENQLEVKQPLTQIFIKANQKDIEAINVLEDIIKEELNIKNIVIVEEESKFNVAYLVVNFGNAGRVLKGEVQKLKQTLESASDEQMQAYVKEFDNGKVTVELFGELEANLFERKLKAKPEYVIMVEKGMTIVLDVLITDELKQEGLLRKVIRGAQVLRKEADFEIDARINANFKGDEYINALVSKFEDKIKQEVLIKNLGENEFEVAIEKQIKIDEHNLTIKLGKIMDKEKEIKVIVEKDIEVEEVEEVVKTKDKDKDKEKKKEIKVEVEIDNTKDKGINIVYEDNHLLVVIKPQNIPVQEDASKDKDLLNMLKDYLKEKYNKPGNVYLGLVHRLDRPTGGVMVFAKTSKAASRLSESIREGNIEKKYLATVVGTPRDRRGTLVNYLKKDTKVNIVKITPQFEQGAKRAELSYHVMQANDKLSLLEVDLKTGRSHQIRVQLSNIHNPVFGDVKYKGDIVKGWNLALWAYKLKFTHPTTKQVMSFISFPPKDDTPWKYFNLDKHINI